MYPAVVYPLRYRCEAKGEGIMISHPIRLSAYRQFLLSAFWFAINLLWGGLLMIVIPSQIKRISPLAPAQTLGFILGVGAFPAVIIPLIVGPLSDRCRYKWGRRSPYMLGGTVVNLFGLWLIWYAGYRLNLWLYFLGYLVVQVGNNIATAAYSGIIPDIVPEAQKGEASGWMAMMSQLGTIAGAGVSGILMRYGDPGACFLFIGFSMAFFLWITLAGTKEKPLSEPPLLIPFRDIIRSLWIDPRKHPDFAWVWITRAFVVMGLWTIQEYLQYYLTDIVHVSDKNKEIVAAELLICILLCASVTGFLGGMISDRIGRKKVVYASNILIAALAISLPFVHTLSLVFALGSLLGMGYGAYYSVDWALVCDVLPSPEDNAKDMAVWHIALVLPQSVAMPIAGWLLGSFGGRSAMSRNGEIIMHYSQTGYEALFALTALYLILGALFLKNVKGVR